MAILNERAKEQFIVPIGPQHPALKEPGHFRLLVDGEVVIGASARLGYAHRGIEKATESRNWVQNLYLLERICGICSHAHAMAYSLGVELLAGVSAPPRAQAIRTLVAELERMTSHLLWLGVAAHEAGFETLFMYSWRDRERLMDTLEMLTGNRVNHSVNLLGGVKVDLSTEQIDHLSECLAFIEERAEGYLDVVTNDAMFQQRTRGIGVMTEGQAERVGVVGPTARASGLDFDIRLDAPYAAYDQFLPKIVVERGGDLDARFKVRIGELIESCALIRRILSDLPTGELVARLPRKIPPGEAISRIEAPRGELFYFLRSTGGDCPDRIRVRTPTICNLSAVVHTVIGHQLADVPMILAGVDPCFSCNDRAIVIENPQGQRRVLNWDALRQVAKAR